MHVSFYGGSEMDQSEIKNLRRIQSELSANIRFIKSCLDSYRDPQITIKQNPRIRHLKAMDVILEDTNNVMNKFEETLTRLEENNI